MMELCSNTDTLPALAQIHRFVISMADRICSGNS
jgi:hypothetical protein